MSAPTRQFASLSLGQGMPTTRAQAQRLSVESRAGNPRDSSSSLDESSDDEAIGRPSSATVSDLTASRLRSPTGIIYDVRTLSPESRERAETGLRGTFRVVRCWSGDNEYGFQLAGHGFIRIREGELACNCTEDDHSTGKGCAHVFWLLDRLYRGILPRLPAQDVFLSPDGSAPQLGHIYDLLEGDLERIAARWHWPMTINVSGAGMSKQDTVRDILSTFEINVLPEQYLEEQYSFITRRRTLAECLVPGELDATIFRLAMNDDDVYRALRETQPAPPCASHYYNKMRYRISALISAFDTYCTRGTPSTANGTPLEVEVVAARLLDHVRRIDKNLSMRGQDGNGEAADCLIVALYEVCVRDRDAFEGIRWRRRAKRDEREEDRNLYHQLIRRLNEDDAFVLDVLAKLPAWALQQRLSRLVQIRDLVDQRITPPLYEAKLRGIIAAGGGDMPTVTGSSGASSRRDLAPRQKRTADAASRGGQKRSK